MNDPHPATYPCPACQTPADLATGCPGCGRRPDPEAAEVIRLGEEIQRLTLEVEQARRGYADAVERLRTTQQQRDELAARVRTRTTAEQAAPVPVGAPAPVPAPGIPPAPAAPARPEASSRTVQSVLFILGSLLLGSAAIVFTAVAWATFGVVGRAAVLAAVTVLFLAVPPVALLRRLTGTAETFAALGLLLVLLDGYAAWYVDLAGVQSLAPASYAGIACAVTAAVALGYGAATQLAGPRFAALVVAQPVLPLLVVDAGLGMAGWAGVLTALAAANLAVAWWTGRRGHAKAAPSLPRVDALSILAWVVTGGALLAAAGPMIGALVTADAYGSAIRTGLVLILAAAVVVAAAMVGPVAELRHVAAGGATLAVLTAVARVTVVGRPSWALAAVAAEIAALAAVVRALPGRVRPGPRVAALLTAGVPGLGAAIWALLVGLMTAAVAVPAWRTGIQPVSGSNWWPPVAIALLGFALAVLLPRRAAVEAAVGTAAVLALAVPRTVSLPWWTPSILDGLVVVPLALASVTARSVRGSAVYGGVAGLLAAHAILAGLARPAGVTVVLAALVVVATTVAVLGRATAAPAEPGQPAEPGKPAEPGQPAEPARRVVGAAAAGVALLALPGLVAAVGTTAGAEPATVRGLALAGLVVAVTAVLVLRRVQPAYAVAGAGAVLLGGAGVAIAAVAATPEPYGVHCALAVLCDAVAVLAVLPAVRRRPWAGPFAAVLATVPAGPVLAAVAPAAWAVLVGPYNHLDAIWSGAPAGVGLGAPVPTGPYALGPAAAALTLLTLALLVAFRAVLSPAAPWAALPATPAILAAAAAWNAPWPIVPALSLAIGLAAALAGALRRPSPATGESGRPSPTDVEPGLPSLALAAVAAVATGAGLAGAFATRAATLTALAVILVVATLCGLAGRVLVARAAGWLVAAASAAGLALASALAADASAQRAAFWVLGAAALTLAASAAASARQTDALRVEAWQADARPLNDRRVEAWLLEGAAHATALVALLLTVGSVRYTAGVCTLWGLALGLRALRPGEPAGARRLRVAAAAGCELVAYWLLLVAGHVAVLEAYTLPAAAVALLAGWLAARTRPVLRSWSAYGPALLAVFGPSLAVLLTGVGEPARRLAVGGAAVIVVVAGSVRRRQAPVVVGGATLALVAVHEAVLVWDLVPRWIPLAIGGLLLVGLAVTYERRRRDVARLREAVGRMR
ncbi:SCO7613 C-terminal domain-containing membrane protein [Planosporangium mesophilum]|uniref:Uncharacterized protein n=1 Tax=Planosporangium mesophilum TaxID=689768 RepID=A0A8J3TDU6_9ACTN|nr:hypothetical protein [Planosporangium mesophilum]NJC82616.1 hypothetical protein [Planosporangium mesophilum]GII24983.1 hypothetical protein Pme01_45800 [Planosporangium mesophilum]